jgi:hypothetical protein
MSDIIEPAAGPAADISAEPIVEEVITPDDAQPTPEPPAEPAAPVSIEEPATADEPQYASVLDYIKQGLADITPKDPDTTSADEEEPTNGEEVTDRADDTNTASDKTLIPDSKKPVVEEPAKTDANDSSDQESDKDKAATAEPSKLVIPSEILGRQQIDERFLRAPKEIREIAGQYGEAALSMKKAIDGLGGEHMLEPLTTISKGLIDGDNLQFFGGAMAAVGAEAFVGLIGDAVEFATVQMQNVPETDDSAIATRTLINEKLDSVFTEAYGVDFKTLTQLAKYHEAGLLNTDDAAQYFDESVKSGGAAAAPNEELQAAAEENEQLKARIAELEEAKTPTPDPQEAKKVQKFSERVSLDAAKNVEADHLATSALRDVKGDTPELVEAKKGLRSILNSQVDSYIKDHPDYKKLETMAAKGETGTGKFKRLYATLIDSAVFQAKQTAEPLESLLALAYGGSRNSRLKLPSTDGTENYTDANLGPTDTEQPKPADVDPEQWRKYMASQIAQMEARAS